MLYPNNFTQRCCGLDFDLFLYSLTEVLRNYFVLSTLFLFVASKLHCHQCLTHNNRDEALSECRYSCRGRSEKLVLFSVLVILEMFEPKRGHVTNQMKDRDDENSCNIRYEECEARCAESGILDARNKQEQTFPRFCLAESNRRLKAESVRRCCDSYLRLALTRQNEAQTLTYRHPRAIRLVSTDFDPDIQNGVGRRSRPLGRVDKAKHRL